MVRASCPTCSEVEVRGEDFTIRCCIETMRSMYRFRCPRCASWTVKDAGPGVITLLLRAGARVERWRQPLELDERPGRNVAPLTEDDLIDFHEALQRLPTAMPGHDGH
jgi:hypothetical protein